MRWCLRLHFSQALVAALYVMVSAAPLLEGPDRGAVRDGVCGPTSLLAGADRALYVMVSAAALVASAVRGAVRDGVCGLGEYHTQAMGPHPDTNGGDGMRDAKQI